MTREKRGPRAKITYQGNLKCCTFEPFVPNFFVGLLLEEESRFPEAVSVIRRKIASREYALPIGLVPRLGFQVEFNSRGEGEFGNREDWLCPYYRRETESCGIWKYRGSVCTTFYCRSDAGPAGLRFWEKLSGYLSYAEMTLLEEALVNLDFSPRQISACLDYVNRREASAREIGNPSLPLAKWKELWNGYDSEIESFYRKCAREVRAFDRERFREALGEWGAGEEAKTLQALRKMKEKNASRAD